MVCSKHSKNHPGVAMNEIGQLGREQLKGFVGRFYLFFPKPFPNPIAAKLARCPDNPKLEKSLRVYSGRVGPLAVERYAMSDSQQAEVRAAVLKALDQLWLAFDGFKRAFVDNDPLYARWRKPN